MRRRELEKIVVIGCSAGGVEVLKAIFRGIAPSLRTVIVVCQHVGATTPQIFLNFLQDLAGCPVKEAESQETIETGQLYFAPSGYHLLVSPGGVFELNVDDPVNYSRPAIDVLFESAAEAYGPKVLALVLTGANHDGAAGARTVLARGGRVLIQDPREAAYPQMPEAAVKATGVSETYSVEQIAQILRREVNEERAC